MKALLAIVVAATLIGCAQNKAYFNPTKTNYQATNDWNECRYDSKKFGYVQMWGTGVGPGIEQVLRERGIFMACMEGKGYYLVERSESPATTTSVVDGKSTGSQ